MKFKIKISVEPEYAHAGERVSVERELELSARIPPGPDTTVNSPGRGLETLTPDQLAAVKDLVAIETDEVVSEVRDDVHVFLERAVQHERKEQIDRETAEQAVRVADGAPVGG